MVEWNTTDRDAERECFALKNALKNRTPRHGRRGSLTKLYRSKKPIKRNLLKELNVIDGRIT